MTKKHLQDTYNTNPKDLLGIKKDNISLVPPEGIRGIAKAMEFGAKKYGAYNWRSNKVQYKIYLDAIMRHTLALVEGQDIDPDSTLSHLDHIGANVVILKDAMKYNCLVDNRDKPKNNYKGGFIDGKLNDLLNSGYNPPNFKDVIFNDFNKKDELNKLNKMFPQSTNNYVDMGMLSTSGNEQHNTIYGEGNEET